MYFIMTCDPPETENGEAVMEIHNCFKVGTVWHWRAGKKFEPDELPVPEPIRIRYEPLDGYAGPPVELVDQCIPIMSEKLAGALTQAGVDNLDFYRAILTNTVTGEEYAYRAYNVVGLVAAADLEKSVYTTYDNKPVADVSFRSLAFDESKAQGTILFRLAEDISALFVHERVRDHILDSGISTLTFIEPADWVRL